jgi:hypothetical protein
MWFALACALLAFSCTPRLAVTVRSAAPVRLGPVKTIAVLTHQTRLGVVMRERVLHDLGADGHFVLVKMCGERSCEPVDAFVRLYERDVRVAPVPSGNVVVPTMMVAVETDVVAADTRPLTPRRDRTRAAPVGGDLPQTVAERLVSDVAGEVARELFHPKQIEYLVFEVAASFTLGIKQASDLRIHKAGASQIAAHEVAPLAAFLHPLQPRLRQVPVQVPGKARGVGAIVREDLRQHAVVIRIQVEPLLRGVARHMREDESGGDEEGLVFGRGLDLLGGP